MPGKINAVSKGQYTFEDGTLTYCPTNDTVAIFYAQSTRPHLSMAVYPMGKVTSDLSVLTNLNPTKSLNSRNKRFVMFKIAMLILILLLVSMNVVEEEAHEYLAFLLLFSCVTLRLRSEVVFRCLSEVWHGPEDLKAFL